MDRLYHDITGIILAGGSSSRMGVDKALLRIGKKTALEIIAATMQSLFAKNMLGVRERAPYAFLNLEMVPDLYPQAGPLTGINAALAPSTTAQNFVISCDQPLMRREKIDYYIRWRCDKKIVVARAAGRLQLLPGLYRKSLLPQIKEILHANDSPEPEQKRGRSLRALLDHADAQGRDFYREEFNFNINEPTDYEKVVKRLAEPPAEEHGVGATPLS